MSAGLKTYIYLLGLVTIIFGCVNYRTPDEELVFNVDNQFEINIKEVLDISTRSLEFSLYSLSAVECDSTKLDMHLNTTTREVDLDVLDVIFPENCGTSHSYPYGTTSVSLNKRKYNFNINILDVINHKGTLEVNDNQYIIDLNEANGLVSDNLILNRIPDRFVWGFYQTQNEEELKLVNSLFEVNEWESKIEGNLLEGYYSYFTVDKYGKLILEGLPVGGIIKTFAISDAHLPNFKQTATQFKVENPSINIVFYGSDGSVF